MSNPQTSPLIPVGPTIPVDSLVLREAADAASSNRGARVWCLMQDGGVCIQPVQTSPDSFAVTTSYVGNRPRPPVSAAGMTAGTDGSVDLLKIYEEDGSWTSADAVFWTEAAVEKFVFPYYASKMQWDAPTFLSVMAEAWYGHVPGTINPAPVILEEPLPFAIVHIPRSDYAAMTVAELTELTTEQEEPETDAQETKNEDLMLLTWIEEERRVKSVRMSDLMRQRRGAA